MSKLGAVGRGLWALTAFLINTSLRVGLNVSLIASVAMTIYAVSNFSKEAIRKRKEVLDLIYWRDPKKSGIALALTLIALFILAKYPILSVVTYTSLLVLAGTLGFRIFKAVEAQIKKTEQANPFQPLLDTELSLPQEKVHEQVDVLVEHGQLLATQTRRLFLVESIVDSVKFGLFLWALTYISAWFSGFGLLIVFVLGVFSIPKFYEVYQEPIDQHLSVIKGHIDNVTNIVEEKLPFLKRARVETEKKEQ
ncbi:unnamed protein product, partial [Mesorhabditis belari]|uniref:Reticulon-like protein n=1 Tax=Mesorhabditis belari TaxID=2138241 RepID=A0AAF3F0Z5_9BILA